MSDSALRIARAAQTACVLEVCAPKPGNVNRSHDFHDAGFAEFMASALALGPVLAGARNKKVGRVILEAVQATGQVVASNINLGIVLLLAPMAKAAFLDRGQGLKPALVKVLADLDEEDAALAYQAINLAAPSGMGQVAEQDLSRPPAGITLLGAMDLARQRDRIAEEYVTGFSLVLDHGLARLNELWAGPLPFSQAVVLVFLELLARHPDTLIARKLSWETARRVSARAAEVLEAKPFATAAGDEALAGLDDYLRDPEHKLNPGTTADLTAGALFAFLLQPAMIDDLPGIMRRF